MLFIFYQVTERGFIMNLRCAPCISYIWAALLLFRSFGPLQRPSFLGRRNDCRSAGCRESSLRLLGCDWLGGLSRCPSLSLAFRHSCASGGAHPAFSLGGAGFDATIAGSRRTFAATQLPLDFSYFLKNLFSPRRITHEGHF
jgi:hypothetical protein